MIYDTNYLSNWYFQEKYAKKRYLIWQALEDYNSRKKLN